MRDPIDKPPNSAHRSATRLLCMVHELHREGFQRVRFSSGMAPSGLYWRCSITHAGNMSDDGLHVVNHSAPGEAAAYSTASHDRYFDWPDAPGLSAPELAVLFTQRFPLIVQNGKGRDWAYAGWLTEMLGRANRNEAPVLPIFFADYPIELEPLDLPPPINSPARRTSNWTTLFRHRRR